MKHGRITALQALASRRRAVSLLAGGVLACGASSRAWAWAAPPEKRLVQIYRLIAAEKLWPALDLANALVRDVPNFRLAQLVRADLLRAMHGNLAEFGALAGVSTDAAIELRRMCSRGTDQRQPTPPGQRWSPRAAGTLAAVNPSARQPPA